MATSPSVVAPAGRLPTVVKAGWGMGSAGTLIVINANSLLLLFFMTTVLGIAPALAGGMLFSAKLVDAVMAPTLGAISDRTVSRWGRRRPYLLAGAIVSAVAVAAVFSPPAWEGDALTSYMMGCLLVLAAGYTLFNVPYIAMPAEMTDEPVERTSIISWRIVFVSIGGLITGFGPPLATAAGGGRQGYAVMGMALAGALFVAMLVAIWAAGRTRSLPPGPPQGGSGIQRFAVVFRNRPFMLVIAAKICQLVGLASISASVLFFLKSVIEIEESFLGFYVMASTAASIGSMPIWVRLGRRGSKRTLYIIGCLGFAVTTATWLLAGAGEPPAMLILRAVVGGFFSGGLLLMGQSLLPDTIDYDCKRSGERREGIYAGAYSFVEKSSMAFGPLIVGLVLQAFGFQPGAATQVQGALTGVYIGSAVLPSVLYALSVVPLLFLTLKPETPPDAPKVMVPPEPDLSVGARA